MADLNKSKIIELVQSKINQLNLSNTSDQFILPNIDSLDPNKVSFVSTVDDLPDLLVTNLPSGQLVFVDSINIPVISNKLKWIGLDGVTVRNDDTTWYGMSWGDNSRSQLGNPTVSTFNDAYSPVTVVGNIAWKEIVAGDCHSAGIDTKGVAWTWGQGFGGRLGNNSVGDRNSPVSVVGGFTDWIKIRPAGTHTLGLRANGTVWAWGLNLNGQLGDGTVTSRESPVSVIGNTEFFNDWSFIGTGFYHTLALRSNGTLWGSGCNDLGQLGDNTVVNKSKPFSIGRNTCDWISIDSGDKISFGIKNDGTLWAWGRNNAGQLGVGTTVCRSSPVSVVGGFTDWQQVSAGRSHALALRQNGTIWSWGCNICGRLGDLTLINRSSPVIVSGGFTDWCGISAGLSHNAGLRINGTLWTWGENGQGQLGDGTFVNKSSPVSVVGGLTSWCQVSAGDYTTAAVTFFGRLWEWGAGTRIADGDPGRLDKCSPVSTIGGFTDWCQVSSLSHTVAVRRNGTLWAWASNTRGQLGNGNTYNTFSPVSVLGGFTDWCRVSVGYRHTVAVRQNGTIWTWGSNGNGELGDGTSICRSSPVVVLSDSSAFFDWCDIAAPYRSSVGLRKDGTIWTWGSNSYSNMLGDGTNINRSSPVSVLGNISDWCKLAEGFGSVFAIRSNGTLWGWGSNYNGELGVGFATIEAQPTRALTDFNNICKIATGYKRNILLTNSGRIWSWGYNSNGSIGDGTTCIRSSPVSVIGGFTDWCDISSNKYSFFGVRSNGTLWSWGENYSGQLGDGTVINRSSPVSVVGGFTDWVTLSGGEYHSVATRTNGTLWTWGNNFNGQLGEGGIILRSSPVSVIGGFTDWCQTGAGEFHSAAIRSNGTLWTWGSNNSGQLGDGTTISRSSPVSVVGGFTDWCQVTAGGSLGNGTAAVRANCTIWNWGWNWGGFLATGDCIARSSPVQVPGQDWCKVFSNSKRSFGQKLTGELWSWGYSDNGELGNGIPFYGSQLLPSPICCGFTDWSDVSVNPGFYETTFGIRNGCAWAWGVRMFASFGDNLEHNPNSPVPVCGGFTDWCQISGGNRHSGGIRSNGTLWTWGGSFNGALGHCTLEQTLVPKQVIGGVTNWCCFTSSYSYTSAAVKQDATLWVWGSNVASKLGIGELWCNCQCVLSPVPLQGLWCSISGGGFHMLGIRGTDK